MKQAIRQIVGKRISGVIVKEGRRRPRSHLFLLFDDGTYYEMHGNIRNARGLAYGGPEKARVYLSETMRIVVEEYSAADVEDVEGRERCRVGG